MHPRCGFDRSPEHRMSVDQSGFMRHAHRDPWWHAAQLSVGHCQCLICYIYHTQTSPLVSNGGDHVALLCDTGGAAADIWCQCCYQECCWQNTNGPCNVRLIVSAALAYTPMMCILDTVSTLHTEMLIACITRVTAGTFTSWNFGIFVDLAPEVTSAFHLALCCKTYVLCACLAQPLLVHTAHLDYHDRLTPRFAG